MARIPGRAEQKIIRAITYSEAGGSWLGSLELLMSVIVGVRLGVAEGLIIYAALRIIRVAIGWYDLHRAGWIAYRAGWYSGIAPPYVRLLRRRRK